MWSTRRAVVVVSKREVLRIVLVAGPAVPLAYLLGASHAPPVEQIWGGVTPGMQQVIVPWMFLSALGFLVWAFGLWRWLDSKDVEAMQWPARHPDGKGADRLAWAMLFFLVPSIFWLEATILHLTNPQSWTPDVVVFILFLVGLGNVMALTLTWSVRDRPHARWMVAGIAIVAVQTVVNDLILWSMLFPW